MALAPPSAALRGTAHGRHYYSGCRLCADHHCVGAESARISAGHWTHFWLLWHRQYTGCTGSWTIAKALQIRTVDDHFHVDMGFDMAAICHCAQPIRVRPGDSPEFHNRAD